MAQTKTMRNAAKPTYDCAALSDIHFAIVDKYSIITHANAHQYLNHGHDLHDALSAHVDHGHDLQKSSPLIGQLKQDLIIFVTCF